MGLFKIFSRGSERTQPRAAIWIGDLEGWIRVKRDQESREVAASGERVYRQISNSSRTIVSLAHSLADAEVKVGELTEKIASSTRTAKSNLAKKMIGLFTDIQELPFTSFEDLMKANDRVMRALKDIAEVFNVHGRHVAFFFKNDLRKVKGELDEIQASASKLAQIIAKNESRLKAIDELGGDVMRHRSSTDSVANMKMRLSELENESDKLQKKLEEVNRMITEIEATEGFKASATASKTIRERRSELDDLASKFDTSFQRLSRPLRKYIYLVPPNKEQDALLESYLNSPFTTLLSDNELLILRILDDLKQRIGSRDFDVKKPEGIKAHIEDLQTKMPQIQSTASLLKERIDKEKTVEPSRETLEHDQLANEAERLRALRDKTRGQIEQIRLDLDSGVTQLGKLSSKIGEKANDLFQIKVESIKEEIKSR